MPDLGIVVALDREAAALGIPPQDSSVEIVVSGLGRARAAEAAARLSGSGAQALLSVGLAGGLQPDLPRGAVVVASSALLRDGDPLETDPAWRRRVLDRVGGAERPLLTLDAPAATPEEKAALHTATGAGAVDMEAYAVAEMAARSQVPFLAIKVVVDDWRTALPVELLGSGGGDGWHLLMAALSHPGSAGAALRLARDGWAALRSLRRVALGIGPGWGL